MYPTLRMPLAWMVPSGNLASVGRPPASPRAVPGILKTSQCRTSSGVLFRALSGSCMISTKLAVLAGTLVHSSLGDGEVGPAAWVNLSGMMPPSWKSGDDNAIPGVGGALGAPPPFPLSCAKAFITSVAPRVRASSTEPEAISLFFMGTLLVLLYCVNLKPAGRRPAPLYVQIAHVEGVFLDELAAAFDVLAHERGEDLVALHQVLKIDLE